MTLDPDLDLFSLLLKLFWLPELSLRVLTGNFDTFGVHLERSVFSLLIGGLEKELAVSSEVSEVMLMSVYIGEKETNE